MFNPLSPVSDVRIKQNPWNNFFVDNELKQEIGKDVDRTFQERSLFTLDWIKTMMTNILFTWAKANPDISYKQGMNEILGTIIFVAYAEQAPERLEISRKAAAVLKTLNSPDGMEADTYWLFARVMELGVKELFNPVINHGPPKKRNDLFEWDTDRNELVNTDKSNEEGTSYILRRCHKVHHRLLQSVDRELYNHIERQRTEPQMYLQRWLRCVLSREFNFADTLALWDAMFACVLPPHDEDLVLLDFICIAMLEFVRGFRKA